MSAAASMLGVSVHPGSWMVNFAPCEGPGAFVLSSWDLPLGQPPFPQVACLSAGGV